MKGSKVKNANKKRIITITAISLIAVAVIAALVISLFGKTEDMQVSNKISIEEQNTPNALIARQ